MRPDESCRVSSTPASCARYKAGSGRGCRISLRHRDVLNLGIHLPRFSSLELTVGLAALSCTIPCMTIHDSWRVLARRSFVSKLGFGLVGGAAVGAAASPAQAQSTESARWQPVRHAQDDWLDQIPGKHRYIFDAPNPEGFASALQFLNNYFNINQNDYGLKDSD